MNRGIRNYCRYINHSIGNVAQVYINVNKNDANMHVNFPLYQSKGLTPINLSLMFTLSDMNMNDNFHFGKGIRLNFYKKYYQEGNKLCIRNCDGSIDEYLQENNYINNETNTFISFDENGKPELNDMLGNKFKYNSYHIYPSSIHNINGNSLYFSFISNQQISTIRNGIDEFASFEGALFYYNTKNLVYKIEINKRDRKRDDANYMSIREILLAYDDNDMLKSIIQKNHYGKIIDACYIQYREYMEYGDNVKILEIMDGIAKYKCKYWIINDKVEMILDGYGGNIGDVPLIGGRSTRIIYNNHYSEIENYKNCKTYIVFDENDFLAYEIDDKNRVISYSFDKNKRLISKSAQNNDSIYAFYNSLVKNGYFNEGLHADWQKEGNGTLTIAERKEYGPFKNIIGYKKLSLTSNGMAINNEVKAKQLINIFGHAGDIFTFIAWCKPFNFTESDSAKARISLRNIDGDIVVTEKEISFLNKSEWQYGITEVHAPDDYNNIVIELIVKGPTAEYWFDAVQLYQNPSGVFYEYDEKGNSVAQIIGNDVFNLQYTDEGFIRDAIGSNLMLLNHVYDDRGNLEYAETRFGLKFHFDYDSDNNVTKNLIEYGDESIQTKAKYEMSHGSLYKNIYLNDLDQAYSHFFDNVLLQIKEAEDYLGRKTKYYYNEYGFIRKQKLLIDNQSKSIIYTFNPTIVKEEIEVKGEAGEIIKRETEVETLKNQIDTITLDNGVTYKIEYEEQSGRLKSIIFGKNNHFPDVNKLVEYTYSDEEDSNGNPIYTAKMASKEFGSGGDKFLFYYDNKDRLIQIKLRKKGSTEEILCYTYAYDYQDRLISRKDKRLNTSISYEYDINNRLVNLSESQNYWIIFSVDYLFDNLDEVIHKKTRISNRYIFQTYYPSYIYDNKSRVDFFEKFKYQEESSKLVYSCFFNQMKKISNDLIGECFDATAICKTYEGEWTEKRISPRINVEEVLQVQKDEGYPYIVYESGDLRLEYTVNIYDDANEPKGTVMFWFKPNGNNVGKCLFCVHSNEDDKVSVYIDNSNKLVLRLEVNKVTHNITSNLRINQNDWNFFALTWDIKWIIPFGGSDGSKFTLYLNNEDEMIEAQSNQIVVLQDSSILSIGSSFIGNISAIAFTDNGYLLSKAAVMEYYHLCRKYIFTEHPYNNYSSTNYYNRILLERFNEVVPLNNSFYSISGKSPLFFSRRPREKFDIDRTFEYNCEIQRYAYVADGQKLIYDFGLPGNMGSTALRIYICETTYDRQYLFQHKDANNRTLGLYRMGENLFLQIDDIEKGEINTYDTGLSVPNEVWTLVTFTWRLRHKDHPEYGTVYEFTVDRYYVNNESGPCGDNFLVEVPLSFVYSDFITSVGRKMDSEDPKTSSPLKGQIEMFSCKANAIVSYSTVKNVIAVSTNQKKYDGFGRICEKKITKNGDSIFSIEYEYKNCENEINRTTSYISKEKIKLNTETLVRKYEFNYNYNLSGIGTFIKETVIENWNEIRKCYYDYFGQLMKECIAENGIYMRIDYEYYPNGNIKSKTVFNTSGETGGTIESNIKYEYDVNWKDRLIQFGPEGVNRTIEYEDSFPGNPTFYYRTKDSVSQGVICEWEGRRLTRYFIENYGENRSLEVKYYYNDQGLRIKKFFKIHPDGGEWNTLYYYEGSKLVSDGIFDFLYDETGALYGLIEKAYDPQPSRQKVHFYIRDVMGNIVGIVDEDGNLVVKYVYDSYGNIIKIEDHSNSLIGSLNPFRFKGYYYDSDTMLYYCNSRFYNPEWGRWLNADDAYTILNPDLYRTNLYAYPVNGFSIRNIHSLTLGQFAQVSGRSGEVGSNLWKDIWDWAHTLWGTIRFIPFKSIFVLYGIGKAMIEGRWDDLSHDWENGCFHPFNQSEQVALSAKVLSFYKGSLVLKQDFHNAAWAIFGTIFLYSKETYNSDDLNHEWGHTCQERFLGPYYLLAIAIPSGLYYLYGDVNVYYSQPWERTADWFGGVNRGNYNENSLERGILYFALAMMMHMTPTAVLLLIPFYIYN